MNKTALLTICLLLCVVVLCSCGENKLEGRYVLEKMEMDGVGLEPMGTDDSYLEVNSGLSFIYLSLGESYSMLSGYVGNYRDSAAYQVFNFRVTSCIGDLVTNAEGSTIYIYYYPKEDRARIDAASVVFWYEKEK